ncbi:unnamed protein product, partial [Prorocentrum cordatum]
DADELQSPAGGCQCCLAVSGNVSLQLSATSSAGFADPRSSRGAARTPRGVQPFALPPAKARSRSRGSPWVHWRMGLRNISVRCAAVTSGSSTGLQSPDHKERSLPPDQHPFPLPLRARRPRLGGGPVEAIVLLLAFTPHACAAAPSSGEVAQAFVGPDGARALAQPAAGPLSAESRAGVGGVATVAVDAQGNSFQGEVAASVLLAGGSQQLPAGHSGYQQPAAPGYSSGRRPRATTRAVRRPSCSSLGFGITWTSRGARSWTRSIRIEMPDGTRCTVTPPGKWSFWMASEVAEMMCKAGVWVDGKGKPVLEIEMKTAQWFLIASAVTACVLAYLLYKMFYDTESSWYTWRQDQAVKWGFATAPPPPAEDADGAASASGPQAGINISISNASGSQPAPEAKPQ